MSGAMSVLARASSCCRAVTASSTSASTETSVDASASLEQVPEADLEQVGSDLVFARLPLAHLAREPPPPLHERAERVEGLRERIDSPAVRSRERGGAPVVQVLGEGVTVVVSEAVVG